jgi:hypothetical protein
MNAYELVNPRLNTPEVTSYDASQGCFPALATPSESKWLLLCDDTIRLPHALSNARLPSKLRYSVSLSPAALYRSLILSAGGHWRVGSRCIFAS